MYGHMNVKNIIKVRIEKENVLFPEINVLCAIKTIIICNYLQDVLRSYSTNNVKSCILWLLNYITQCINFSDYFL